MFPISMIVCCGQGPKEGNGVKRRKDRFRLNVKEKRPSETSQTWVYGDGFLSSTMECNTDL